MGFTDLGLSEQVLGGVRTAGYAVPTPIQTMAIVPALEGKDIIGCAQTGTGKTAAFVLPLLHRLSAETNGDRKPGLHPRALVVTPTRELAQQVDDALRVYGSHTSIRSAAIYGGVGMEPQLKRLRKGVDVIVSTPGRLLDHLQRGSTDLSHVRIVVLDEADKMLDMGFIHDVTKILQRLPSDRQTLLFSATVSDEIQQLAGRFLRNPQTVRVGEVRNPADGVTQHFYATRQEEKVNLLTHVLNKEKMESVLVFSRTKHGADKIARRLEKSGVSATALHSNRTQGQRQRALDGFKKGRYRVLVATDIAARGIDVDGISHVINYDIPQYAEDYIHRIGRTGRAGERGDAITFVVPTDRQYLRRIEAFTGRKFSAQPYPGFHSGAQAGHSLVGAHAGRRSASVTPPRHVGNDEKRRRPFAGFSGTPGRKRRFTGKANPGVDQPRKKKTPRRFETFSTDRDGGAWSNY